MTANLDTNLNQDETRDYISSASVLLQEVAMKLYTLKVDGPKELRYAAGELEEIADDLSDGIYDLLCQHDQSYPLTESDQTIARLNEQLAELRAKLKRHENRPNN